MHCNYGCRSRDKEWTKWGVKQWRGGGMADLGPCNSTCSKNNWLQYHNNWWHTIWFRETTEEEYIIHQHSQKEKSHPRKWFKNWSNYKRCTGKIYIYIYIEKKLREVESPSQNYCHKLELPVVPLGQIELAQSKPWSKAKEQRSNIEVNCSYLSEWEIFTKKE